MDRNNLNVIKNFKHNTIIGPSMLIWDCAVDRGGPLAMSVLVLQRSMGIIFRGVNLRLRLGEAHSFSFSLNCEGGTPEVILNARFNGLSVRAVVDEK